MAGAPDQFDWMAEHGWTDSGAAKSWRKRSRRFTRLVREAFGRELSGGDHSTTVRKEQKQEDGLRRRWAQRGAAGDLKPGDPGWLGTVGGTPGLAYGERARQKLSAVLDHRRGFASKDSSTIEGGLRCLGPPEDLQNSYVARILSSNGLWFDRGRMRPSRGRKDPCEGCLRPPHRRSANFVHTLVLALVQFSSSPPPGF